MTTDRCHPKDILGYRPAGQSMTKRSASLTAMDVYTRTHVRSEQGRLIKCLGRKGITYISGVIGRKL